MYFEGSEKKFELIARGAGFRQRPQSFWSDLVELAGAKILSQIHNEACEAFLLSESSLFVWEDRVIMITCGRTTLVRAAAHLIEHIGSERVDFLTYERKNEYFPHQQETDFHRDWQQLHEQLEGTAFRFGSPDEHHLFLYHLDRPYKAQPSDCTLELLMYNLQGRASQIFNCHQTCAGVRELTGLQTIFPDFEIDDHLFHPCGYSMNAIRGSEYFTLHVTPEETGSYVSFETNVRLGERMNETLKAITESFQPRSFDVIYFHPERGLKAFEISPFVRRSYVRQSLNCGYDVGFSSYFLPSESPQAATLLEGGH